MARYFWFGMGMFMAFLAGMNIQSFLIRDDWMYVPLAAIQLLVGACLAWRKGGWRRNTEMQ